MDNRRDEYLDKIVNFLVDDTIFDYENNVLIITFPTATPIAFSVFLYIYYRPFNTFPTYCKDTYGLTDDEIGYVWDEYRTMVMDKINSHGNINESVDRKDDYIKKILNYLVDDTKVDQKNKTWYPPFPTPHPHPMFKTFYNLIPMAEILSPRFLMENSYVRYFFNYCSDTYGLSDFNEIQKLWLNYLYALTPKINGFTINESVDRKKEYLNRVVDFIVQDTVIDYGLEELTPPFFESYSFYTFVYPFWDLGMDITPDLFPRTYMVFRDYLNEEYGLTEEESKRVWEYYWEKIYTTIKKYFKPINESVDRKKEYLNRIVDFIVQDTEIDYKNDRIEGPFPILSSFSYLPSDRYVIDYFSKYCEDTYGLTDDEIKYVWKKYINKIVNKKPIKESVNRKQDYLDKIVGYLVDDTKIEVVSKRWNPPFMTIWLERSGLFSHDVPHAGIFHRFYEYCKETYGLTDGEMMGVWNKYTKSLIYKLRDF